MSSLGTELCPRALTALKPSFALHCFRRRSPMTRRRHCCRGALVTPSLTVRRSQGLSEEMREAEKWRRRCRLGPSCHPVKNGEEKKEEKKEGAVGPKPTKRPSQPVEPARPLLDPSRPASRYTSQPEPSRAGPRSRAANLSQPAKPRGAEHSRSIKPEPSLLGCRAGPDYF